MWLADGEGIPPRQRAEQAHKAQLLEELARQALQLVGAHRQRGTLAQAAFERVDQAVEGTALDGDVGGVEFEEAIEHRIELGLGERDAAKLQPGRDHMAAAEADLGLQALGWHRLQSAARERMIDREDQVGRRIDQSAVEIENECRVAHGLPELLSEVPQKEFL